jgi:hypothetical protein
MAAREGAAAASAHVAALALPAAGAPLIGRSAEPATLATALAAPGTRLLTLTGPPGVGKTRLALATASAAIGRDLLRLVAEGFARLQKEMPAARMVMVTGPRIDPKELPDIEGLDKRGYVHNLYEHLAAADAAVVQGGLSTTMELVALRRPFVYFPLGGHWERRRHDPHRLAHYRAGIRLDYGSTSPAGLAIAMRTALAQTPRYRAVPRAGARRGRPHRAAPRPLRRRDFPFVEPRTIARRTHPESLCTSRHSGHKTMARRERAGACARAPHGVRTVRARYGSSSQPRRDSPHEGNEDENPTSARHDRSRGDGGGHAARRVQRLRQRISVNGQ